MMCSDHRRGSTASNEERRLLDATIVRGMNLVASAVVLATWLAAPASAEDAGKAAVPPHELQAKAAYCKSCHGPLGQGFHGFYPIPRLAGQQPDYIKNQLRAFDERRRTNNIMLNVSHVLSPAMVTALAAHFQSLDPKPIGGAPKELVAEGKKIYQDGEGDVPACASCHGPEAKGDGEFPRLAGQLNDYIFNKLTHWSQERGQDPSKPDTSAIMQPIAHSLTEQQIKAVAAYLNYLQ
jgi:cytochrome c553